MTILLPDTTTPSVESLTPREIVAELDKYVVGQAKAKRAVAIALRNRYRRQRLTGDMADEVAPKNILMIGPTGVGKTEIARRLARLAQSPFIKVEASKFTEVGYVGRDVESMVRDLVEIAVKMVREERETDVREKARQAAEERLLDLLLPTTPPAAFGEGLTEAAMARDHAAATREKLREQLHAGRLDGKTVELDVRERAMPSLEIVTGTSVEEVGVNLRDMLPGFFQGKTRRRRLPVREALEQLAQEESQKLIDMDTVAKAAIARVENAGIIFVDEIDKIAGREGGHGPDVSREGVQRDILPIVEGTTVTTKHGMVRTDHILFIAAGAFHVSKPSDLIPELQGRFPIRVELEPLGRDEFVRILTEPRSALIKQYTALMATEAVTLAFTDEAIQRIAELATLVNERTENIGARRLHTVMERLLDEVSFDAPALGGRTIDIDAAYVDRMLAEIAASDDLSRYISVRRGLRSGVAIALAIGVGVMIACGKKGPPLPPLRPLPARVSEIVARRLAGRVELRFTIPSANADNTSPPAIARIDVYARSVPEGSPRPVREQIAVRDNLVGSIAVKPPAAEPPPPADTPAETTSSKTPSPAKPVKPAKPPAPPDTRPAPGTATMFTDTIPTGAPLPLPPLKHVARGLAPPVPATAPKEVPKPLPATRYFLLVPVSRHGQTGPDSDLVGVPLTPPPASPSGLVFTYDAKTLTAMWTPGAAGETFRVYDVDDKGQETSGLPLSTAPLTTPEFHAPAQLGTTRCLAVRAVEGTGLVTVESDPAVWGCKTQVDIFPPPAPENVSAFADAGVVTLRWDPVNVADLGGYLVLRGDGTGDTLQQLTPAPIAQTTFRDPSVRAGATYTYAVVAVDTSKPPNQSPKSTVAVTVR